MPFDRINNISEPKKVMIIGTAAMNVYQQRLELIQELQQNGVEVCVAVPYDKEIEHLLEIGVVFKDLAVDNRGSNPWKDLKLLRNIVRLLREYRPDLVLTFYTKTNIYGGIGCRLTDTPYIMNITGLGSALSHEGMSQKLMSILYRTAARSAREVFFQNKPNMRFFHEKNLWNKSSRLLPGSGVALKRFLPVEYPMSGPVKFTFIGRVIEQKGIVEFVEAARILKERHGKKVEFHVVGPARGKCLELLKESVSSGLIKDHGKVTDTRPMMEEMHCLVYPSYYAEGMANVILESAATGRPVITTGLPGCGEGVDDGVSGFVVKHQNVEDLVEKMERIVRMTPEQRREMGANGRKKMEREFDRKIVVEEYMNEIGSILGCHYEMHIPSSDSYEPEEIEILRDNQLTPLYETVNK